MLTNDVLKSSQFHFKYFLMTWLYPYFNYNQKNGTSMKKTNRPWVQHATKIIFWKMSRNTLKPPNSIN